MVYGIGVWLEHVTCAGPVSSDFPELQQHAKETPDLATPRTYEFKKLLLIRMQTDTAF